MMTLNSLSRRAFLKVSVAGVALAAMSRASFAQRGRLQIFEKGRLSIRTAAGVVHYFKIEIARNSRQHAQGLMYRRSMAADAGMLFLYRTTARASMWMKNTYIPLDMIFISGDGRIVGYSERTVPGSLEVITSKRAVNAVLEVNAGTVSRLKIAVGDRIIHPAFQLSE